MKSRRFSVSVIFFLFVPILVILLLAARGAPGQVVQASFLVFDNHFACWVSGPISRDDHNWGDDKDEFVLDRRDLGEDARFNMKLNPELLRVERPGKRVTEADKNVHSLAASELLTGAAYEALSEAEKTDLADSLSVYTLFDSVPELVDYAFALDVFDAGVTYPDRDIYDRRVRLLAKELAGVDYTLDPKEDHRMLLPWQGTGAKEKYLERRSGGAYYSGVKSLSAEWIDHANPDGGREVDSVALARDQTANWLEGVEGTITTAGDGGVVHYGTTEGIGQQVLFETRSNCGIGGSCDEVSTYSNNPVPIILHSNIRAQNDGEIDRNTTVKDARRILVKDGSTDAEGELITVEEEYEFDPANITPSSVRVRDAHQGGYSRMHQEDTSSDELRISLVLKDKYRRDIDDYKPDMSDLNYKARGLPAMGVNPWTYVRFKRGRHHALNDWVTDKDPMNVYESVKHMGYRQPGLDRPESFHPSGSGGLARTTSVTVPVVDSDGVPVMRSEAMDRWDPKHIKWPANFEDLNWYLYELPTDGYRESLWLYWLTREGTQKAVFSAYGSSAIPFSVDGHGQVPVCEMAGERDYPGVTVRPPLNRSDIDCETEDEVDWHFRYLLRGDQMGVHLPFDASDPASAAHLLGPDLLVKQGSERAEDVKDPRGTRKLSRFDFSILESQPMGEFPPEEDGYPTERFYGIPRDDDARTAYIDGWRSDPIDPNMPYLLVFTFYEAKQDGDVKFQIGEQGEDYGAMFKLPKRRIRRVICRAMIHPSGFNPSTGSIGSLVGDALKGVISFVNKQMEQLGGWLAKILASISEVPLYAGVKTSELACVGLGKLDDLTSLGDVSGPAPPALVDQEGRIRVNAAVGSKLEGAKRCHRISSPPVSTCERDIDMILQGKCVRMPEFRLQVRTAEFIRPLATPDPDDPTSLLEYDEYRVVVPVESYNVEHGERDFVSVVNAVDFDQEEGEVRAKPKFDPLPNLTLDPPPELNNRNRGLTRVYLEWDLRWDTITTDFYDRVDGFAVVLHPDQKSVSFPVPEQGLPPFYLPKWVYAQFDDVGGAFRRHTRVDGFAVGGLSYYPDEAFKIAGLGSDSLAHWSSTEQAQDTRPASSGISVGHYRAFNKFIHDMPLAPGFTHGFQVAPYTGVPEGPGFQMGPLSEKLLLLGDSVACDHVTEPDEDVADIRKLYDCRGGGAMANLGYTDDEFRPGLLALTGTDICDDIFSSTPAGFTWDNAVVKQVWGLIWIIAGAVLFTLLVWQGLRMTYDIWLDPQPAIGFRELVPRFLLAVLLAAGSLVMCRMVLVVASDLTCFVAQITGMSLWGVVGVTFGHLVDGYMAWYDSLDNLSGDTLLFLLKNYLLIWVFGFLVLLVMLYLLYLFAKVVLAMLMRIALLAVLVALSPLAFAFYASDATSHWTKRWVSMFLGTTFQQVVVLLVIYIGVSMIGDYLSRGSETGLTSLLVGMIFAFLTLSLATAVPDIVNPGRKGLFSSFTQLGSMALAAAVVVGSAGVGAFAGGMGAAMAGGARVAPSLGGGPSPDGGPGGGGGGSGPGPAAPAGGGGIISSVSRSPMGVPVGPGGTPRQQSGGPQQSGPGIDPSGQPAADEGSSPTPDPGPVLGPAPSSPGPAAPQERGPGFLSRVASGVGQGWVRGSRWGAGMNVRASNLASGQSFYRHSSRGDDAAEQIERLREEQSGDRTDMRNFYRRIANALDPQGDGSA